MTLIEPRPDEVAAVQQVAESLDRFVGLPRLVSPNGETIELPLGLFEVLKDIVGVLKQGNGVTVFPVSAVLTTAEAAKLLNVSRPHVVKLIKDGEIPHHMAGSHRRVKLSDVVAYQARQDETRRRALAEIHLIAEETGMPL